MKKISKRILEITKQIIALHHGADRHISLGKGQQRRSSLPAFQTTPIRTHTPHSMRPRNGWGLRNSSGAQGPGHPSQP